MRSRRRRSLPSLFFFLVMIHIAIADADLPYTGKVNKDFKAHSSLTDCPQCVSRKARSQLTGDSSGNTLDKKDIDIIVTYSNASGAVKIRTVKSRDLSHSWVWRNPNDESIENENVSKTLQEPSKGDRESDGDNGHSSENHYSGGKVPEPHTFVMNPVKLQRQILRRQRRSLRTSELIRQDKDTEKEMEQAAIERTKEFDTTVKETYGIWRIQYTNPNSDSTLKLMHDWIIMAKAYANIAKAKNEIDLYDSLLTHSRESQLAIGEAYSDAELQPSALDRAKAMGHVLSTAKDQLYDCLVVARKLRAMLQSTEVNVNLLRKKSAFLIQLAAKVLPRPLHCLPLQLTADYYLKGYVNEAFPNKDKLEDTSLSLRYIF